MKQYHTLAKSNEAICKEVVEEISRHKAIVEQCIQLFATLAVTKFPGSPKTISAIPDDLRRASKGLQQALDDWSRGSAQTAESLKKVGHAFVGSQSMASRQKAIGLRSELENARTRLVERDIRITGLLNEGLCLAFKKEELEERLLTLVRLYERLPAVTGGFQIVSGLSTWH